MHLERGREGRPVGGRLVSAAAAAGAGQLEVMLETIPLLDMFRRLHGEGTQMIDGAFLADVG
jgi:hypothetical protein